MASLISFFFLVLMIFLGMITFKLVEPNIWAKDKFLRISYEGQTQDFFFISYIKLWGILNWL